MNQSPQHVAQPQAGGFSLIEVLLALGLVALLASMATPHLQAHWRAAQRTAAQAALLQLAAQAEAHYSQHGHYEHFALDPLITERVAGQYQITLTPQAQHYVLTATPLFNDRCGTLRLLHDGRTQAQAERCWR